MSLSASVFRRTSNRLFFILYLGIALLLVLALAAIGTEWLAYRTRTALTEALLLERDLGRLQRAIREAEVGQLGYQLTGQNDYLINYRSARDEIGDVVAVLGAHVNDEPIERRALEEARRTVGDYLEEISRTVSEDRRMPSPRGQRLSERVTEQIEALRGVETEITNERRDRLYWITLLANGLRIVGILGLAVVFYYLYTWLQPAVRNVDASDQQRRRSNERLQQTVTARNVELLEGQRRHDEDRRSIRKLNLRNRELDEFTSLVSHDLREPLRTVTNFTTLLEEDYGERLDEDGREQLAFIQRATKRMKDLVDNLLAYSRVGRMEKRRPTELNKLTKEVLENLSYTLQESKGQVTVGPLGTAPVYPIAFRQLLQNLLANALKFHRPGEPPRVELYRNDTAEGRISIIVKDFGIGIPEAERAAIFRFSARSSNAADYEGQGVGLAFCKKVIDLHRGEITVSDNPDGGTIFIINLPANPIHEPAQSYSVD